MKRWLLAVAALLCGTASVSYADYVVIKYNLSAARENNNQPMGQPGFPGLQPGQPMGAQPNFPMPMGGLPMGLGGMGPAGVGPGEDPEDVEISPLYVIAVIDLKVPPDYRYMSAQAKQNGLACKIIHKWGTTWLKAPVPQPGVPPVIEYAPLTKANKPVPSISKEFENRLRVLHQEKPAADTWADLAEWTLRHGLMTKFHEVMDEFGKAYPDNEVVKAYKKMKADLERPAASNRQAADWKSRLNIPTYKIAEPEQGHYTLLHNSGSNNAPEVVSRLTRMEDAFASFYYWMALRLQDKADKVKVPQERLLAILVPQAREFDRIHDLLDDQPLVADGFYARRDNLLVLSALPRSQAYEDLKNLAGPALQGGNVGQLLNGKGDNDLQTLALVMKALEEDGELATVSHETPRQLLAASGLLARHVAAPRWAEFGMGGFFGTSRGSPWQTLGSPSTSLLEADNYLYTYKVWRKAKKLDDPKTALEKVVTDGYFRMAQEDKENVAAEKARATAWALTYFLAQRKTPELLAYYGELSRLPRDLEFDDQVLLRCFARAFGLIDPKTNQPDQARLATFAREWDDYIVRTPVEFEEAIKEIHKTVTKKFNPGTGSGPGVAGPRPAGTN
jgi:hypothetical protein